MSDLIDRLRRPGDYTGVWAIGADTAAEAADALEAQERLIAELAEALDSSLHDPEAVPYLEQEQRLVRAERHLSKAKEIHS